MSLTHRILDSRDEESIRNLWLTKKSIFKLSVPEDYAERLVKRLGRMLTGGSPKFYIHGVFNGGELIATWVVMDWIKLPYYSLNELVVRNEEASPTLYTAVINTLLNNIFPLMESRGRFQFYILTLLRPYQLHALEQNCHWPIPPEMTPYDRYDVTVEAVIPKNEVPEYDVHWGLMGETRWPCDLWVRRGSLKREYCVPELLKKLGTT